MGEDESGGDPIIIVSQSYCLAGGGCAQRGQRDRLKLLLANGARVHGGELTKAAFA